MMGRDMRAMEPTEPLFWAVMSLGVIVGFFVAYPVNVWMVSKNLKHGLMHVPTDEEQTAEPSPNGEVPVPHAAMSGVLANHGTSFADGQKGA